MCPLAKQTVLGGLAKRAGGQNIPGGK